MIHKNFKQQQTGLAILTAVLTAIVDKTATSRGRLKDSQKVNPRQSGRENIKNVLFHNGCLQTGLLLLLP